MLIDSTFEINLRGESSQDCEILVELFQQQKHEDMYFSAENDL